MAANVYDENKKVQYNKVAVNSTKITGDDADERITLLKKLAADDIKQYKKAYANNQDHADKVIEQLFAGNDIALKWNASDYANLDAALQNQEAWVYYTDSNGTPCGISIDKSTYNYLAKIARTIKENASSSSEDLNTKIVGKAEAKKTGREAFESKNRGNTDDLFNLVSSTTDSLIIDYTPTQDLTYKNVNLAGWPTYLTEYGNSYFVLQTWDKSAENEEQQVWLNGVLREMPEISFSTSWEDGPGATAANWLNNFIKNDLMEAAQFFAANATVGRLSFSDGWTSRLFEKSEINSITLSFRIYTKENVGAYSLCNKNQWIEYLTAYTPINLANKMAPLALVNSLRNTADAVTSLTRDVKDALGKGSFSKNGVERMFNAFDSHIESNVIKFGENRVVEGINKEGAFGAKLFMLHIYPFYFKHAFPVYISSWRVTPSKETCETTIKQEDGKNINIIESVYYDFEVVCELDQVPSMRTLDSIVK